MAGFFQQFLKGAAEGFFGSVYLKDYKHASKTFVTNAYGYSPKFKWLFHVYFDINQQFITQTNLFPSDKNFGLAVKSVQLPKYSFDLTELNQYNRKRIIQNKVKYDPVTITFHDDNQNLIRKLWYAYYSYNIFDPNNINADLANTANQYNPDLGTEQWGYSGADAFTTPQAAATNTGKVPFFKYINIYGFNQHNFALYQLVNPIIDSFNHDTYDYYQTSSTMENTMTLRYEYVKYFDGALNGNSPDQIVQAFGTSDHYDRDPSPLSKAGTRATILGQGGLIDAGLGIQEDLSNGNVLGAIQKAGSAYKTFSKPGVLRGAASAELLQGARAVAVTTAANFKFPTLQVPNVNTTTGTNNQQTPPGT